MTSDNCSVPRFLSENFPIKQYCSVPCSYCGDYTKVLYVLGRFKGEIFSSFRYLCVICRAKLKQPSE